MGIDKSKVRQHFERHAHHYDQYAFVQVRMASFLLELVQQRLQRPAEGQGQLLVSTKRVQRILEIGCGTGILTERLAAAFPDAELLCIDLSKRMIEQTRSRLAAGSVAQGASALKPVAANSEAEPRISFAVGDAEELLLPGGAAERWLTERRAVSQRLAAQGEGAACTDGADAEAHRDGFDLIVSNAVFQWLTEPERTMRACVHLLRPVGGVLAFSTFGQSTFWQLHASFREAERQLGLEPLAHGQNFAGAAQWAMRFSEKEGQFEWISDRVTERYSDVRHFMHTVKRVGAGNAMASPPGIGGRRLLEMMERLYTERYPAASGGIVADYELGFGLFVS